MRVVDIDVTKPPPERWSVASLGLPLPMVAIAVFQTAGFALAWGQLSSDVHTLMRNQDKGESQVYQLKDAQRDFALRDQVVEQLTRRVAQLEQNDGKHR